MSKTTLIKELYVGSERVYRSKKAGYTVVNMLEPVRGYSFTSGYLSNEGQALVIKHPDGFKIPISREELGKILNEVTMINGVIQEPCALVQTRFGFGLVKGLSEEYTVLRAEYEASIEKESEKKAAYLKRQDVYDFDELVFLKGKTKETGFQYVGEVFLLPFETRTTDAPSERLASRDGEYKRDCSKYRAQFKEKLDKRFFFVKVDNQGNVRDFRLLSSFPDVISRKEGRILDRGRLRESMKIGFRREIRRITGYGSGDFSQHYLKGEIRNNSNGGYLKYNYYNQNNCNMFVLDMFYENVGVLLAKEKTVEQFGPMLVE